ncbi:EF-hand domain-containing protein [Lysobacter panacisoli]|uniref:EF-hand domain-containing protein n=1 Tax=Lysobacter panacisoli TaxID=1255263 RepID=A0ABP9L834_9GAMM|nr:EF-hand domain-containing protein [Lysobacter panacisoli]
MSIQSRKPLIIVGLVAALSAPLAFAQTASPTATQDPAAASPATADTAAPQKKSWADVDVDKNGSLSKNEASTVPALSKVFEQADADADGALTADEYKSYVAKAQGGSGNSGGKR